MNDISPQVRRRITKELQALSRDPIPNISAGLKHQDNPLEWTGTIFGPEATPYEGGVFHLDIVLPSTYPRHPPQITFKTKVYHPNIDANGTIAISILTSAWCPALTVANTLLTICSFLDDPFAENPDPTAEDALIPEIAELYLRDREQYDRVARRWVELYAQSDESG